jgi:benzylsuccinate CoA-transferase BbsF subunit
MLAGQGAVVVKVESAIFPDTLRTAAPFKDSKPGLDNSIIHAVYNNNKLSMKLNLKHPKSKIVTEKLIKWADVVVENFPAGKMAKWDLDWNNVKEINPGAVMVSTSIHGQTGPWAHVAGYGSQLSSLAGFTEITGWPDREPAGIYGAYTDYMIPYYSMSALVAALIEREKTGLGVHLDLSQLECSLQFLGPLFLDVQGSGKEQGRNGNRVAFACPHGVFRCKGNDEWVAICVSKDEEWEGLKKGMQYPDWAEDKKFSTFLERKKNETELEEHLQSWTLNSSKWDVVERLQKEGVAASAVAKSKEVLENPQLHFRKYFVRLKHPEIDEYVARKEPFMFSRTPERIESSAPCLGAHTHHVCTELLKIDEEEFVGLMQDNVFE